MPKVDLTPYIRAQVIDIQRSECEVEKIKILVDTNVLYFIYYDRFSLLETIGEGAKDYQLRQYASFFKKLLSSNTNLFVHRICLFELAHRIELAEQKILFCEINHLTTFKKETFNIKEIRQKYHKEFETIKRRLFTYFHSISKTFNLLNFDSSIDVFLHDFLSEWNDSIGSAGDAMMMAEAKREGIDSVLSDDSDFISFDDIKFYTANNIAIAVDKRHRASKN